MTRAWKDDSDMGGMPGGNWQFMSSQDSPLANTAEEKFYPFKARVNIKADDQESYQTQHNNVITAIQALEPGEVLVVGFKSFRPEKWASASDRFKQGEQVTIYIGAAASSSEIKDFLIHLNARLAADNVVRGTRGLCDISFDAESCCSLRLERLKGLPPVWDEQLKRTSFGGRQKADYLDVATLTDPSFDVLDDYKLLVSSTALVRQQAESPLDIAVDKRLEEMAKLGFAHRWLFRDEEDIQYGRTVMLLSDALRRGISGNSGMVGFAGDLLAQLTKSCLSTVLPVSMKKQGPEWLRLCALEQVVKNVRALVSTKVVNSSPRVVGSTPAGSAEWIKLDSLLRDIDKNLKKKYALYTKDVGGMHSGPSGPRTF